MSRQDVNWSIAYNATQDVYTVSYASTFSSLAMAGANFSITAHPSKPLVLFVATSPDDQTELRFDRCTAPRRSTRAGLIAAVAGLRSTQVATNTAAITAIQATLATLGSMALVVNTDAGNSTVATNTGTSGTYVRWVTSTVAKSQDKIGSDFADVTPLGTTSGNLVITMNVTGTFVTKVEFDVHGAVSGSSYISAIQNDADGAPVVTSGEHDSGMATSAGNADGHNVSMALTRNATITAGDTYGLWLYNSGSTTSSIMRCLRIFMTRVA